MHSEIVFDLNGFPFRLKSIRKSANKNIDDFAILGGVSSATQSSYENGNSSPNLKYIQELSLKGIDVIYLLTGSICSQNTLTDEERLIIDIYRENKGK